MKVKCKCGVALGETFAGLTQTEVVWWFRTAERKLPQDRRRTTHQSDDGPPSRALPITLLQQARGNYDPLVRCPRRDCKYIYDWDAEVARVAVVLKQGKASVTLTPLRARPR